MGSTQGDTQLIESMAQYEGSKIHYCSGLRGFQGYPSDNQKACDSADQTGVYHLGRLLPLFLFCFFCLFVCLLFFHSYFLTSLSIHDLCSF